MKNTTEELPETTSDEIQWMFHNEQVTDRALSEILVREYYVWIFHAALKKYANVDHTRQVTLHTLARAVASRHLFWEDISVEEWIWQIMKQEVNKVGKCNSRQLWSDWDRPEVLWMAQIGQYAPWGDRIWPWLSRSSASFPSEAGQADSWVEDDSEEDFEALTLKIEESSEEILNEAEIQAIADQVAELVQKQRKEQSRHRFLRVSGLVSMVMLLAMGLVWWAAGAPKVNLLAYLPVKKPWFTHHYYSKYGDTIESLAAAIGVSPGEIYKLNPTASKEWISQGRELRAYVDLILPVNKPKFSLSSWWHGVQVNRNLPQPLTINSPAEEIKQRFLQSELYWNTLQLDLWMAYTGLPGYVGQAQFQHYLQLSQPGMKRVALALEDVIISEYIIDNRIFSGQDSNAYLWGDFLTNESHQYTLNVMQEMLMFLDRQGSLRVLGETQLIGRKVLVVDWIDRKGNRTNRIWIDSQRGIPLAWTLYTGADLKWPFFSLISVDVQFDRRIPIEAYNPTSDHPELDIWKSASPPSGEIAWLEPSPQRIEQLLPPPAGFEVEKSSLVIQWPLENIVEEESDPRENHQVLVLGDGYYLGNVNLRSGYWQFASCARSEDGALVALSVGTEYGATDLIWFPLNNLADQHFVSNETQLSFGEFTFSPDNKLMAYLLNDGPRIFILDLATGKADELVKMERYPFRFGWSPNGQFLWVMMYSDDFNGSVFSGTIPVDLWIYHLGSKKNVEKIRFNYSDGAIPPETSAASWNIDFPSWMTMQSGCWK